MIPYKNHEQLEELVKQRTYEFTLAIERLEKEIKERNSIEKSLRESEGRYKNIISAITDYIYTVYIEQGRPVRTVHSPACVAVTGYTEEEFKLNPYLWLQMVPEEDQKIVKDYALQILTGINVKPIEHRIIHRDGSIRWIRNTPVLHYDKKGNLLSYDGLIQDITERKQAEEILQERLAMEELATIISSHFINLPFSEVEREITCALQSIGEFVGVDRCFLSIYSSDFKRIDFTYEWCNKGVKPRTNIMFLEPFFWGIEKLKRFEHLYIPSVSDLSTEVTIEKEFWQSSGIKSLLGIPLQLSNNVICYFGLYSERSEKIWKEEDIRLLKMVGEIFVHVLERKQVEEELRKYRNHLEYLVEQRTLELTKATEQLIRSERLAATGQLAASVAHEINSPLQAITVLLSTLKNKYKDNRELSYNLVLLKSAFRSIRDTVKNLLDLNRPGNEKRQPVNINTIIENTISLLKSHLKKSRIKINLELSQKIPVISASPRQLSQVFINLINNAVEATGNKSRAGGKKNISDEITIKSEFTEGHIIIKVTDTGPGIPDEELSHIFDPFYTKKKVMGMGVGLTICHGIIEDHKGSIDAKNVPEGGAEFIIQLPVSSDQ